MSRLFSDASPMQIAVAALFCLYAVSFIARSSFTIGGTRYFSLFDDDMISMRYASNLAHGYGLIWNPEGPKVLGFTNPLWVLYMAAWHLLPIPASKVSLCIQISGASFLLLNLFVVGAISRELAPRSQCAAAIAVALTAFYGPLNNWSLQGTEVSVLTLVVSLSVWLALLVDKSDVSAMWLYVLLGISTLVRPDAVVFSVALLLAMAFRHSNKWQRHLINGGAVLMAFLAAQAVFNLLYYGEALPNTYYLKMTGFPLLPRIRRGIIVAFLFLLPWIPIGVALSIRGIGRYRARIWPLVTVIAVQLAYSIWVGGDAWEWYGGSNRYISIAMPLVFVLSGIGIENLALGIVRGTASTLKRVTTPRCAGVITVLVLVLVNLPNLPSHLLLHRPIQTDGNQAMVTQALLVRQITDEHATIAVVWAGAAPYFAGRQAIDLLGKNDIKIAREPMRSEATLMASSFGFWPGHQKWDYGYSIGQLKPDVILQLWAVKGEAVPELNRDYVAVNVNGFTWYMRQRSQHVLWSRLPAAGSSKLFAVK